MIGEDINYFILFDIGANVGDYSLLVASHHPSSTVYSFEPSEFTFNLLKDNTKLNSNIYPFQIAFGEETRQANLYSDKAGSGMASLFDRNLTAFSMNFNQSEIVNIVTLDDWVATNNITPDYIKIDVEGAELLVLKDGIKTLENIRAVQFEFGGTAIDAKTYFKDYYNFFVEQNFTLNRYTPTGLLKIDTYSEKEELFEFMNYVAFP